MCFVKQLPLVSRIHDLAGLGIGFELYCWQACTLATVPGLGLGSGSGSGSGLGLGLGLGLWLGLGLGLGLGSRLGQP